VRWAQTWISNYKTAGQGSAGKSGLDPVACVRVRGKDLAEVLAPAYQCLAAADVEREAREP